MTFNDLVFEPHPNLRMRNAYRAAANFPNGYGVSVVTGSDFYTDMDSGEKYELAVMHNGTLCYDTPITSDVIGHCTKERITELLAQVEALPPKE